jgi:hypothetical protein
MRDFGERDPKTGLYRTKTPWLEYLMGFMILVCMAAAGSGVGWVFPSELLFLTLFTFWGTAFGIGVMSSAFYWHILGRWFLWGGSFLLGMGIGRTITH